MNKHTVSCLAFCIFLTLCSCSMPRNLIRQPSGLSIKTRSVLYRIEMYTFWVKRYTGLLAVETDPSTVSYALIDPLGITLLEGLVERDGRARDLQGLGKIKKSNVPQLLADSLSRIYLIKPEYGSCSPGKWHSFCESYENSSTRIKMYRSGFFTNWYVEYLEKGDKIHYNQPLLGVSLKLTPIY